MAKRPIFVPSPNAPGFVEEINFEITWHSGFAPTQKAKNIIALHEAAFSKGYTPLLEVSTKSSEKIGRHLSAFHLKVNSEKLAHDISLESAYQGSKVFEHGGPFVDLYEADARTAKRDPRLKDSGRLVAFDFNGVRFPLEPKTVFYDWLYVNAIYPYRDWLARLFRYAGFTDIEFNPNKSVNCQARSCALFVVLMKNDLLATAIQSPKAFIDLVSQFSPRIVPTDAGRNFELPW